MPVPNANDPLRTTDPAPAPQPEVLPTTLTAATRLAPEVGEASSPAGPGTVTFQAEGAAESRGHSATAPCEPPLAILGYAIEGVLGHGGMGVVYKARQIKANRLVALKMILTSKHASVQEQVRFQIEAEAVAHLQHPNIVQLHEVGERDGMPFFSLEFCAGGSLDRKLKTWAPAPAEVAALVETLARALHHAHLRGVVHRDLKPANVLLAGDGTPKITDFGLAKMLDAGSEISRSGAIMGTPSYMAPEQAEGKVHDTGPAADVYALGALLYEVLAGRPPFKGATTFETIQQVLTEEPTPPSCLRRGTPRDLETICLKCLRKQPAQRFASAEALADDLLRYRRGEAITARAVGRIERAVKWARRRPSLAALLLMTVLGVAGIVWKYLDAEQQKGIAQREADKAKKARDFLVTIFDVSDANGPRGTMTARQILDDAERRIPQEFTDQPELRADLLTAIETVYAKMTANAPLAMILEVGGTVQLQSTRAGNHQPVPQTLLYSGDHLSLADEAQVQLVFLSDLHKERLPPGSQVTVRRKSCEPADAVREPDRDILMTFVRLPKGTFFMGWDDPKKGTKTEIAADFEIAVHPVTQGQWQAVMGENPCHFSRFNAGRHQVKDISDEELKLFPVETVSWDEAQKFIEKLNERQRGRGWLYRLPTEAEWEYACRGGSTSEVECSYHFYFARPTNDLSSEQANFRGESPFGTAPKGRYLARPTRVGAYPPNKLGLCDMHGNVCQWCADPFAPGNSGRAIRGGGWDANGAHCRTAMRRGSDSTLRFSDHGFRLVRVPVR
jgi:formylglycine-generating enzyme required for sulfatase activity/tRNA A-37 threonylcarbamoyl transferase component Bud32